jgi:ribosome-associated toxin RatA of RatAB toxin-antitoxin module
MAAPVRITGRGAAEEEIVRGMSDHATEKTTIASDAAAIRAVLLDFARYPEWVRDLKEVEVLGTDDDGRASAVRFRAAAMGRSTSYTLQYEYPSDDVIAWTLVEGDIMRTLDGHYTLTPNGQSTDVDYELEVDLKLPLPGFVKRRSQGRIMHAALRDLKDRVESGAA